jgi:hypothetical protein
MLALVDRVMARQLEREPGMQFWPYLVVGMAFLLV